MTTDCRIYQVAVLVVFEGHGLLLPKAQIQHVQTKAKSVIYLVPSWNILIYLDHAVLFMRLWIKAGKGVKEMADHGEQPIIATGMRQSLIIYEALEKPPVLV